MKPTINLVLQHNHTKLRFCFNEVSEMVQAVEQLKAFILDNSFKVHEAYTKALREFIAYHEEKKLLSLNDYTVDTVIQDISENKYIGKRRLVNIKTGEIFEL